MLQIAILIKNKFLQQNINSNSPAFGTSYPEFDRNCFKGCSERLHLIPEGLKTEDLKTEDLYSSFIQFLLLITYVKISVYSLFFSVFLFFSYFVFIVALLDYFTLLKLLVYSIVHSD